MSQRAIVQSENGDQLHLVYSNGLFGGKAVLAFLSVAVSYCSDSPDDDVKDWFSKLEGHMQSHFCDIVHHIMTRWYVSDEHIRDSDEPLDQEWIGTSKLLQFTNDLITALLDSKPQSTSWYQPDDTILDFQVLAQTLSLMISRNTHRVRILFE